MRNTNAQLITKQRFLSAASISISCEIAFRPFN